MLIDALMAQALAEATDALDSDEFTGGLGEVEIYHRVTSTADAEVEILVGSVNIRTHRATQLDAWVHCGGN